MDCHKTKLYDFECLVAGRKLYVEVKVMQDGGLSVSLTPREVEHAQTNQNSALIIYGVKVKGKRSPKVSGGAMVFLNPWDIASGVLKPRGFVFSPASVPH